MRDYVLRSADAAGVCASGPTALHTTLKLVSADNDCGIPALLIEGKHDVPEYPAGLALRRRRHLRG